jgi:hypothetical protein
LQARRLYSALRWRRADKQNDKANSPNFSTVGALG